MKHCERTGVSAVLPGAAEFAEALLELLPCLGGRIVPASLLVRGVGHETRDADAAVCRASALVQSVWQNY